MSVPVNVCPTCERPPGKSTEACVFFSTASYEDDKEVALWAIECRLTGLFNLLAALTKANT